MTLDYINSRLDFPKLIDSYSLSGIGVEVGVGGGDFSKVLLQSGLSKIVGVDNWPNPNDHALSQQAMKLISDRFEIMSVDSLTAAASFKDKSLDFVYIDAMHEYRYVSEDLRAWWPKIRDGGILAGHDYTTWNAVVRCECGVVLAVEEFAAKRDLTIHVTGIRSTDYLRRLRAAHLSDEIPSFWIVKD